MKTKIISIVVMLMVACNVMAQDYMRVYFKDGTDRKFYLKDITSIATKKLDADGIQHGDYEFQHITTHHNKYVYNLNEVDSITFSSIDEEAAERNFAVGMFTIFPIIGECTSIKDVEEKINLIRNAEGVETAWSDGHVLNVKIKEDEIYTFHFSHDTEMDADSAAITEAISTMMPRLAPSIKEDGKQMKAVIANQQHKDMDRDWHKSTFFMPIQNLMESFNIHVDYVDEPTIDFFYENCKDNPEDVDHLNIYDYDIIWLITHGSYSQLFYYIDAMPGIFFPSLYGHSFLTSEDMMLIKSSSFPDTYEDYVVYFKALREWRNNHSYNDATDQQIRFGFVDEIRSDGYYWVGHPSLTEFFFRDIVPQDAKFLNPNSIFFNISCQSLKGEDDDTPSFSFAERFIERGLGTYLGYDETNGWGQRTGHSFFLNLLNGKSLQMSYDLLSDELRNEQMEEDGEKFVASLLIYPENNPTSQQCFIYPTYTLQVSQEVANNGYKSSGIVEVNANATVVHINDFKYGFFYGTDRNLLDTKDEISITEDNPIMFPKFLDNLQGNIKFRTQLKNLQPGNTYYYCAYTFDGLYYNCGDTLSFYVPFELQLSTQDLSLTAGTTTTVEITSGNGGYTVSVDKPSIATATLSGTTITIEGVAKGTAKVTLKDKSGQTAEIIVTVWDNLTLSQSSIDICPGNSNTVKITSGNGDYTVSVDKPNIATATLSGTTISIKGEAKGTAKVTVKDKSGQTAEINVKVWDNLTVSQSSVGIYAGYSATVEITSGSGHYSVSVDKPAVATASLSGSVITIKGVNIGSAVVTVTDTFTNQTAKINVTVSSAPTLVVSNSSVDLIIGGSSTVEITSGSGSYEITNSNDKVVQAVLEGAKITLTAKSEGNAVVTVKDKATGKTASVTITVKPIAKLVLSQSSVGLIVRGSTTVEITSGGGSYEITNSNDKVIQAVLEGTAINLTAKEEGYAVVTVKDKATGQTADIKVSIFSSHSMAETFYRMPTFTNIQDANTTPVTAPGTGTNPITVQNTRTNNTPRYLYTTWGEDGWAIANAMLPKTGYCFSCYFTIAADAGVSNCLEFALLPINVAVSANHMKLQPTNDYFFRFHQAVNSVDGKDSIWVNGDVVNNSNWNHGERNGETTVLKIGTKYHICVDVVGDKAKATIVSEKGEVVYSGTKDISALPNTKMGTLWFNTSGACTYQFDDVKLSYLPHEPFTVKPAEAIDLGLPSGTLWASWNVGAYAPEEYGGYYAWGETEIKDVYDLSSYTFYNNKTGEVIHIGEDISGTEYDVAHVKWGGSWHMPTYKQQKELIDKCSWTRTNQNGVNGQLVTGPNGASIFLPAAGYCRPDLDMEGSYGFYWSSSFDSDSEGYSVCQFFNSDDCSLRNGNLYWGLSVRPVITVLTVSQSSVELTVGESTTVVITSGEGIYELSNSNTDIVQAVLQETTITLTAKKEGSAIITINDKATGQITKITVTVNPIPNLVLSQSSVELTIGESTIVEITSGSGNYEVSNSNANIVHATLDGTTITLTALSDGNAVITVKDIKYGHTIDIPVTVNIADICVSESDLILIVGNSSTVVITSGNGIYEISNSNANVVQAVLEGKTITLTALTEGTAIVAVKDIFTGQTANISITVKLFPDLVISQNSVGLVIGNTATVEISSGSGKYTVSVDNPNVVKATLSGSTITIEPKEAGTAVVVVKDSNSGQTIDINIRVFNSDCPVADAIDLGLPSGTLWASWNVGSLGPEEYGGYYAWGESETKDYYGGSTYKYLNRYIGNDIAGTEYDVAHVKWGDSWRMPSINDFKELFIICTQTWMTQNGVNGVLLTGLNGNSIFLPAAGFYSYNFLFNSDSYGYYWSSSLDPQRSDGAQFPVFGSDGWSLSADYRYSGRPVRPILKNSNVANLQVSSHDVNIIVDDSSTVNIISGSGSYSVQSSNTLVATAIVTGSDVLITGVDKGTATIIVYDNLTPGCAIIDVTVKPKKKPQIPAEAIDLGLPSGTKWASWNVGASSPEEYGGYYAWGETVEKDIYKWSTYKYCAGTVYNYLMTKYCTNSDYGNNGFTDGLRELLPYDDAATANWGAPWHMPTMEQQKELIDYCTKEWFQLNGVNGVLVTGPNGNSIFLPAAGYFKDDNLDKEGLSGFYWSSSLYPIYPDSAYRLYFDSESWNGSINSRYTGRSVRAVCP